jgi:hypothetical protein
LIPTKLSKDKKPNQLIGLIQTCNEKGRENK